MRWIVEGRKRTRPIANAVACERARQPSDSMSQETQSTATEPFEIDLDEFMRLVNEGAPQRSNKDTADQARAAERLTDVP